MSPIFIDIILIIIVAQIYIADMHECVLWNDWVVWCRVNEDLCRTTCMMSLTRLCMYNESIMSMCWDMMIVQLVVCGWCLTLDRQSLLWRYDWVGLVDALL